MREQIDPDTKRAIAEFYGGLCAYCERRKGTTWDHLDPIAHGGRNIASNIVLACYTCNVRKGTNRWEPRRMHPYGGL